MADSLGNGKRSFEEEEEEAPVFTIWPPKHGTRDAIVNTLIQNLRSPWFLSPRYISIPLSEATIAANFIEAAAYSAVLDAHPRVLPPVHDDASVELLHVYSAEITNRMIEVLQAKAASTRIRQNRRSFASSASSDSITTSEPCSSVESS